MFDVLRSVCERFNWRWHAWVQMDNDDETIDSTLVRVITRRVLPFRAIKPAAADKMVNNCTDSLASTIDGFADRRLHNGFTPAEVYGRNAGAIALHFRTPGNSGDYSAFVVKKEPHMAEQIAPAFWRFVSQILYKNTGEENVVREMFVVDIDVVDRVNNLTFPSRIYFEIVNWSSGM